MTRFTFIIDIIILFLDCYYILHSDGTILRLFDLSGFSTNQEVYEEEFKKLFSALDNLETMLTNNKYLLGDELLECDLRLFPTLLRFDPVYVGHFKCNKKRIVDYPELHRYLSSISANPQIKKTINLEHIKTHYYGSHPTINPTGIIPLGPLDI